MSASATRAGELIAAFAALTEPDSGVGVTRMAYTPLEREAHALFADHVRARGLTVRTDPAGNTIAELPGTEPGLPSLGTGSHLDSVPHAGSYDGIVGVVGAIMAIEAITDGEPMRHPVRAVVFAGEEGSRFGQACSGSRMAAGMLPRHRLDELADASGTTLAEAMTVVGLEPDDIAEATWDPDDWAAFYELHIEQGTVLDTIGVPVGLVDTISGSTRLSIELTGRAAHTGGTPMHLRSDALAAAAEIVLAAESIASDPLHRGTRMTVGTLDVEPASITTIPGLVRLSVDVRDVDDERQRSAADELVAVAQEIALRRVVGISVQPLGDVSPVVLPLRLRTVAARVASELGLRYRVMPSGASHDAQLVNHVCPTGMIFVPSLNHGVSHAPEELTDDDAIARGVDLLVGTLRALDATMEVRT